MKKFRRIGVVAAGLIFFFSSNSSHLLMAKEDVPHLPKFYLNDKPVTPTIQDLSGFGTRPLRLLVQRNNRARHEELIQVFALGAREGADLGIRMEAPVAGMRVTLYKILQEPDGARYLSMPSSVYFDKPGENLYRETVAPFREVFFVIVFEKTDSPDEKEVNVRYFEERVRRLSIAARTNLFFSSLKLKMKDLSGPETQEFFERDAQLLVDRLIHPCRVFLIRIWKDDPPTR